LKRRRDEKTRGKHSIGKEGFTQQEKGFLGKLPLSDLREERLYKNSGPGTMTPFFAKISVFP
jgi:hypothetical protein